MAFTFAFHTDFTTALSDNGTADGESKACALHEVVELDKTFENTGLLVKGYSCACVLAIEIDAVNRFLDVRHAVFGFVAHAYMALLGVLDGIGDEVCEQLLQTACVNHGREGRVGIVLLEFDVWVLHTLLKRKADVVEDARQVKMLGFDG